MYIGKTWSFFLDRIFDFFLKDFCYPITFVPETNVLFEMGEKKFGYGGGVFNSPSNLKEILKTKELKGKYYITTTNKGRKYKTLLPSEIAVAMLNRIETL